MEKLYNNKLVVSEKDQVLEMIYPLFQKPLSFLEFFQPRI